MLEGITASELNGWMNYFSKEPFDYQMENYRSGIIASAIYNVNRQKTTDKVFKPEDFFEFDTKKISKKQTIEEQSAYLKSYVDAFNSKKKGG